MFHLAVIALLYGACTASKGAALHFRPPAIPLITTDPYTQIWMRADNSTGDIAKHWTGADKETTGILRVDGVAYHFLGLQVCAPPDKPGPVEAHPNTDLAPGLCDISNFGGLSADQCNERCYGTRDCKAYVLSSTTCYLKSCTKPRISTTARNSFILTGNPSCTQPMTQLSVETLPTRTVFELQTPDGKLGLTLTFLQTLFTDDYPRLSRPVYYVNHQIRALDANQHDVQLYFDATAQHVVNSFDQKVKWSSWNQNSNKVGSKLSLHGIQLGSQDQAVLVRKGDRVNIDWGFLHMAADMTDLTTTLYAGSASTARSSFFDTGKLPSLPDKRQPRACKDDLPALTTAHDFGKVGATEASHLVLLAYDDIASVEYYGDKLKGFWTRTWASIQIALQSAAGEYNEMLTKSTNHDSMLMDTMSKKAGDKYASLCALAYRQTLAATKLVWYEKENVMWNFLKEISTNGDMQTMDVIYPGSPMFLYTNPDLLKLLLVPVLYFANNQTYINFTDPYSPHQLGTYPIANANTKVQENMPLENSGNMLLMLLGIVQNDPKHDVSWFYPKFWPVLVSWVNRLVETLPYPADQICTDDFTGRLANNTNLGAKGIVAMEAFAQLCKKVGDVTTNCSYYSTTAKEYAGIWQQYAYEESPQPHYKLSYNKIKNVPDSWSLKYNMLWQKILKLDGPFPWDTVVPREIAYYISKSNAFGVPLDPRHNYVKTDWLSWAAAMADKEDDFHRIMDPIFKFANESQSRVPFTDLYDTSSGKAASAAFIARPVIGGLFAKMLL